jgi:hypothetical protein
MCRRALFFMFFGSFMATGLRSFSPLNAQAAAGKHSGAQRSDEKANRHTNQDFYN